MTPGRDYIGVGSGALIINDKNEALLLRRKKPPEAGSWTIPGGKVSFGETISDAVVRETREELGIEIEVVTLLGVTDHILPAENAHWVAPVFLSRIIRGEPENIELDAHYGFEWFALDRLPENLTLTAKRAKDFYLDYLERSKPEG